jgi:hypothetical protein
MVRSSKIEIEIFNGILFIYLFIYFNLWKLKMEDILIDKDQWVVVDPGTAPTRMSTKDWTKLDLKVKRKISLCLLDSLLLNVSREAMTKAL